MPHNKTRKKRAHSTSVRRNKGTVRAKRNSSLRRISTTKLGQGAFGVVQRPPAPCKVYEGDDIFDIVYDFDEGVNNIYKRYANDANINAKIRKLEAKYKREGKEKSLGHLKPYLTYLKYFANNSYISKLTEYEKARHEFMVGRYISSIIPSWRDYYCLVEYICGANKEATNNDPSDSLAIMEYCGVSLEKLMSAEPGIKIDKDTWWYILDSLKTTFAGLSLLHDNYIYHNDIHAGNVVINLGADVNKNTEPYSLYKTLLIDFGQTVVLTEDDDERGNTKQVLYNTIDDLHNFIVKVIKPILVFIIRKGMFGTRGNNRNDDSVYMMMRKGIIGLIEHIDKIPEPYKTSSLKQLEFMKQKYYKVFDEYVVIVPSYSQ